MELTGGAYRIAHAQQVWGAPLLRQGGAVQRPQQRTYQLTKADQDAAIA